MINISDKTSTGRMSYQVHDNNYGWVFGRGRGNFYCRGWGCGFNPTKPKVRGNVKL